MGPGIACNVITCHQHQISSSKILIMKLLIWLLFAGMALGITACNNDADDSDGSDTSNVQVPTTAEPTQMVAVPASTKMAFETRYPQAQNVVWSNATADDPGGTGGFMVTYSVDGITDTAYYDVNGVYRDMMPK